MNLEIKSSIYFDIDTLLKINVDSQLNQHSTGLNVPTDKETLKYCEIINKKAFNEGKKNSFVILLDNFPVGRIIFEKSDSSATVSYWLTPSFRGKGIMSRALRMGLNEIFKEHKIRFCFASCVKSNYVSENILKKFGFSKINSNKTNFNNFVITKKNFLDI